MTTIQATSHPAMSTRLPTNASGPARPIVRGRGRTPPGCRAGSPPRRARRAGGSTCSRRDRRHPAGPGARRGASVGAAGRAGQVPGVRRTGAVRADGPGELACALPRAACRTCGATGSAASPADVGEPGDALVHREGLGLEPLAQRRRRRPPFAGWSGCRHPRAAVGTPGRRGTGPRPSPPPRTTVGRAATNSSPGAGASGIGRAPADQGDTSRYASSGETGSHPRSTAWATTRRWSRSRASPRRTRTRGGLRCSRRSRVSRRQNVTSRCWRTHTPPRAGRVPARRHDLLGEDALGHEEPLPPRSSSLTAASAVPGDLVDRHLGASRRDTAARCAPARRRGSQESGWSQSTRPALAPAADPRQRQVPPFL